MTAPSAALDLEAAFAGAGTAAPSDLAPHLQRAGWPELWADLRHRSEQMIRSAARDGQLDLAQRRSAVHDDMIELVQFVIDEMISQSLDPRTIAELRALAGAPAVDDATGALPVAGHHDRPAVAEVLPGLLELLDRASVDYLTAVVKGAPIADQERLVAIASGYFAVLVADAQLDVIPLPDDDAVCVVHAVRGGGKIYVARDGSVLFVGSALDFERGLEAFRGGARTPAEKFVRPQA